MERKEKNTHTAVNEKRETDKCSTLFYNRLFYNAFYNYNHFCYFASSFVAQFLIFDIRVTQELRKSEIRNSKLLGIANDNIYLKSNLKLINSKIN